MDSETSNDQLLNALESGDFQTALQLLPKDGPPITIGPEGFTPLHYACRHGEAEVTRLLVTQYKYSIQSMAVSEKGQTPAHLAAEYGHLGALSGLIVFLSTSSNVTSLLDGGGNTPVHTAAACGRLSVIQYLLTELQCSPTCTNVDGETPFHLAAKNGHLGVVKYLVEELGLSTSAEDKYGRTPLYVAAGHGQLEVVRYLIEEKACDPNVRITIQWEPEVSRSRTLMHTASREGHLNVVQYLVNELKCDPSCRDEDGVTPLYLASQEGHLIIVKFLVIECQCEFTVAINNGMTPVFGACMNGHLDVIQFLIEKGCDSVVTDQFGRTPLHYASLVGQVDTIKYLINEHQVDPSCQDNEGNTPLHAASWSGHLEVVQFLVNAGCDPLTRDSSGDTPVHCAALEGKLDVMEFLVTEKGCDPMVRGYSGRTPLHYASLEGHVDTVKYLINEHQVDHSCHDENGCLPLHLASMNGRLEVVQFLVDNGCNPLSNEYITTPIHSSALNGRLNVLEFFIDQKRYNPMLRDKSGQTLLHCVSMAGHLDAVKYLITEHHVDPSCQDNKGNTPLHAASQSGHLEVVQFLVNAGCDPLARDSSGDTPVHSAALQGRLDVMEFLVTEKGCDPVVRGYSGRTPLHYASLEGHVDTVKYLISEHQVDHSCHDENGCLPLHLASMNGRLEVVQFLVDNGCNPLSSKYITTPIHSSAISGRLNVLEFFIDQKRYDPMLRDKSGRTLLHCVSMAGHLDAVKYLVTEHRVDPSSCQDNEGNTPLHAASQSGHLEVVQFLVNAGCDPLARDSSGDTPVHSAALQGSLDVMEFLVTEKGCDPMVRGDLGRTPLHDASQKGHIDIVRYLINKHHVDPSCQDVNGLTPLHIASRNGHLVVVQFLVDKGCNPLARNNGGSTPVHSSALQGRLNIMEFLITDMGCDPMVRDQLGRTPLHYATREGRVDTVKYLIYKHQVDPSCHDEDDCTPLHLASRNGHLEIVKFLVDGAFCDLSEVTKYQYTPMMLACENKHTDVALFLKSKGVAIPPRYLLVRPCVRIHLIGNDSAGKSTLVKALCSEALDRHDDLVTPGAPGIIPLDFESVYYGKVTFYDCVGCKELYANYDIIFKYNPHPVIFVTIDISEDNDSICKALRLWKQFLVNAVSASVCQAQVIIIGTHSDQVSSQLVAKSTLLHKKFESSNSINVLDIVLLDCRRSISAGIHKLRRLLRNTCSNVYIRSLPSNNERGSILSEFIAGNKPGVPAFTVSELLSWLSDSANPILDQLKSVDVLYQTCEDLEICGSLLLLRNEEVAEQSWVVVQHNFVLSHVQGLLKIINQLSQLGIVPLSLLQSLLQQHAQGLPPDLAIRYMKRMMFCSEIDPQSLGLVENDSLGSTLKDETYLFFPSLNSVVKPGHVWDMTLEHPFAYTYACGWHLKCLNRDQFFTPKFLQVLLIQLASQFAFKLNPNLPVLLEPQEGCTIWKNGIRWLDQIGVEVVVHFEKDGTSLTLMLRCLEQSKLHCVRLRSTLICQILTTKMKVCNDITSEEYFIHPGCLDQVHQYSSRLALIPICEVAIGLLQPHHILRVSVNTAESHQYRLLSVAQLLSFEPYECIREEVLRELFDPKNQRKVINPLVYSKLSEDLCISWKAIAIILNTNQAIITRLSMDDDTSEFDKCTEIFTEWSTGDEGTYSALHRDLGRYSIFQERSLLEFCPDHLKEHLQQQIEMQEVDFRQTFDEAMKKGYVLCDTIVVLLIGIAGAGKSHVKSLLLGEKPPPIRQSTPLAEKPVRALALCRASSTSGNQWQRVPLDKFDQMVLGIKQRNIARPVSPSRHASSHSRNITPSTASEPLSDTQRTEVQATSHSESERATDYEQPSAHHSDIRESYEGTQDIQHGLQSSTDLDIEKVLLDLLETAKESQMHFEKNWVYIIDSGGQPQFEELLRVFIKEQTVCLCVTKLNEQLSDCPERPYYDRSGTQCGRPSKSPLKHEETLMRCFQGIQSAKTEEGAPSVFVVGTHRDEERNSKETRAEKNKRLLSMLHPLFGDSLGYYKMSGKQDEVIFPVNALIPQSHDFQVAQNLREKVEKKCRKRNPVKIPLPWYAFEIFLRRIAARDGVRVLSLWECEKVGARLRMSPKDCQAALVYLTKHNILYYNPRYLPGVVFVGSQVLLSFITALVYLYCVLGGNFAESIEGDILQQRCCADQCFFDFRNYGLLTTELLSSEPFETVLASQEFDLPYRPGIFMADELFDLLKGLHIIAPIRNGSKEYIMPCLFEELPHNEEENHRNLDPDPLACPLIIYYPERMIPAGVFPLLVAYLQNKATGRWKLTVTEENTPSCIYLNCAEFKLPTPQRQRGKVTLLHSFQYMEIHVHSNSLKACRQACPRIREEIIAGLKEVTELLHYKGLGDPECAIVCPGGGHGCKSDLHLASIDIDCDEWFCNLNVEIGGRLEKKHKLWFLGRCPSPLPPIPIPGTIPLTISNLGKVLDLLWDARDKWYFVGLQLGLSVADLKVFKKDYQDTDERFATMIQKYLEGLTQPTWQAVITALRQPSVGHETLASHLTTTLGLDP